LFHGEPSCSMRTDGRTDLTKLIVAFRSFACRDISVGIKTRLWARLPQERGLNSKKERERGFYGKRPDLRWAPFSPLSGSLDAVSPGVKQPGLEAFHSYLMRNLTF
jgi:hypothetical protein